MDPKFPIFQVNTGATTISGPTAAAMVSTDPGLSEKVLLGVAEQQSGELVLRLYRQAKRSSSADDRFSCDVHRWAGSGWEWRRKEKIGAIPAAPADSYPYPPDAPPLFWTRFRMTDEQTRKTVELIQSKPE